MIVLVIVIAVVVVAKVIVIVVVQLTAHPVTPAYLPLTAHALIAPRTSALLENIAGLITRAMMLPTMVIDDDDDDGNSTKYDQEN